MKIDKNTKIWFLLNGKRYRVICITWAKDKSVDMEPTIAIVYEDEKGVNKDSGYLTLNSGKGTLTLE